MPRFERGNKDGRGGSRPGAGRKKNEFKKLCSDLAESPDFFDWAKRVFKGEEIEPHVTKDGVVDTAASVSARTYLWDKLADHGKGKPVSVLDMEGKEGMLMGVMFMPAKDLGDTGGVKRK